MTWYDKLTDPDLIMINIMSPITTSIRTITRKSVHIFSRFFFFGNVFFQVFFVFLKVFSLRFFFEGFCFDFFSVDFLF